MLQNACLYKNIMFSNKVNQSIVWGNKGNDRVLLIKSLINVRVCKRHCYKRSKRILV